ncbi:unnamed protein product [Somion occarium]|uniref:Uncharacterized protein n=1 Tax=Somion occarium TaxID=3059160 RepID=A0ABP1DFR6_9APHY
MVTAAPMEHSASHKFPREQMEPRRDSLPPLKSIQFRDLLESSPSQTRSGRPRPKAHQRPGQQEKAGLLPGVPAVPGASTPDIPPSKELSQAGGDLTSPVALASTGFGAVGSAPSTAGSAVNGLPIGEANNLVSSSSEDPSNAPAKTAKIHSAAEEPKAAVKNTPAGNTVVEGDEVVEKDATRNEAQVETVADSDAATTEKQTPTNPAGKSSASEPHRPTLNHNDKHSKSGGPPSVA